MVNDLDREGQRMKRLERLLPWRSIEEPSVQYEMQRMTHKGGWKGHLSEVYIPEPEAKPTEDDNWWLDWPGRYRHIRRVDGRIDEVLWTYETADAQEWYDQKREEEQLERKREPQRKRLQEMSFEEVEAEYFGESDELNRLEWEEIRDRYETLKDQQSESES